MRRDRIAWFPAIVGRDGRPGAGASAFLSWGARLWPSSPVRGGRPQSSTSVGKMSSNSAGWSQVEPVATPGPAKISGTRVERSQRVFLPVIPFSPRCQPWSDQRTTTVSEARPVASRASRTRPTWLSMKLVLAR